ncbi:MAG: hypothetical protein KJO77_10780 [Bacteroidia bacterium]|nr:hypothetical protein [Bacteroidia bacterium]
MSDLSSTVSPMYSIGFIQESSASSGIDQGGEFIFVGLLIWFISLFIVRWLMKRYVLKLMNKSSDSVISADPEELKQSEVKATSSPSFVDIDSSTDLSNVVLKREELVRRAFVLFRKKYFYALAAAILYIIPFLIAYLTGEKLGDDRTAMIIGLLIIYLVYVSLNYYFYRKQFRALDADFGIKLEHPIFTVLRKVVNSRFEVVFSSIIILMMFVFGMQEMGWIERDRELAIEGNMIWFGIGLMLVALLHLAFFIKIRKLAQNTENYSLLILRVFGDQKQALLTFGRLTNFWHHFGSWFTVVDPSFIGRQYRTFSWRTLFTLIFLFIAAVIFGLLFEDPLIGMIKPLADGKLSESQIKEIAFIPGMIIAWILYLQYWRIKISRSYTKNRSHIVKKIANTLKRPRKLDLTFKSIPMFCYDNTWKLAVSEFLKNSKVILMDLRGYSEARKGCEYEVDFIFDNFPINRILFLIDTVSDKDLVKKMITERWEYLREQSPNIALKEPRARIFVTTKGAEADVQSLIDLLMENLDI